MNDSDYMRRAITLAEQAKGYTAPNPMVGAVLVHNGRIIGEGWHHVYGQAHAEVDCLNNVSPQDRSLIPESTMYVTLEPCAHYGNTPPCATRLVQERVKKVVIATNDPFEQVSGRGIDILKEGGVVVATGVLQDEGRWMGRRFFCYHEHKRPYIILKWAQTADGFIAPPDRSRYQITGPEAQQLVHQWRTEEAAIMVGTTTALADNPRLTARLHQGKQPLRIVLDRRLTLPAHLNLFNTDAPTWIINEQEDGMRDGVRLVKTAFNEQLLPALVRHLNEAKILSLIVEGGAVLLNSFIEQGLWDEARVLTGDARLGDGITAPLLNNTVPEFTTSVGKDVLQLFVNPKSHYPYVAGMEL